MPIDKIIESFASTGNEMIFTIHDVGHGFCASLIHDNGNLMLWDCGHSQGNCPSQFLQSYGVTKIDYFFITNYDEDHVSDLPNLRRNFRIRSLFRNNTISGEQLRNLKLESGPISPAMESVISMIRSYTDGPLNPAPAFPGVSFQTFCNCYSNEFRDTNNISLVTFLQVGGTKFVIPGDIENDGWSSLLRNPNFVDELRMVNVFIASHHGRENGYREEVFDNCHPDVIIFSDSYLQYATQEMTDVYARHANGIQYNSNTRYVLTTRNDGPLRWDIS